MYTAVVILAGLLIFVMLTVGLILALDAIGVEQPAPRPERRNVDPQPFLEWEVGERLADDEGPSTRLYEFEANQ